MTTTKQQQAHDLYFHSGLSQQQIADKVGINRKTLYDWRQQGKWLRAKCAAANAPMVLVEQYYGQLAALNLDIADRGNLFPSKDEASIITKLTSAVRTVRRQGKTHAETIEVFSNFSEMLRDKDPELNDKLAGYIDEFLTTTAEGGNWYKDELRRNRQELAWLREYREYVENNFEESSDLLRQNADLTAEFAEQDTLAELEKAQAEILAEAAIRRAARAKAAEQSATETSAMQAKAEDAVLPGTIPIPNSQFPIPDPEQGANGVSPKNENSAEQATTAAFTEQTPHPNTPKNISHPMGSDKQSQFLNPYCHPELVEGPNSQFHNQKLNRAQRRKLEREAAKNKLKAA